MDSLTLQSGTKIKNTMDRSNSRPIKNAMDGSNIHSQREI